MRWIDYPICYTESKEKISLSDCFQSLFILKYYNKKGKIR